MPRPLVVVIATVAVATLVRATVSATPLDALLAHQRDTWEWVPAGADGGSRGLRAAALTFAPLPSEPRASAVGGGVWSPVGGDASVEEEEEDSASGVAGDGSVALLCYRNPLSPGKAHLASGCVLQPLTGAGSVAERTASAVKKVEEAIAAWEEAGEVEDFDDDDDAVGARDPSLVPSLPHLQFATSGCRGKVPCWTPLRRVDGKRAGVGGRVAVDVAPLTDDGTAAIKLDVSCGATDTGADGASKGKKKKKNDDAASAQCRKLDHVAGTLRLRLPSAVDVLVARAARFAPGLGAGFGLYGALWAVAWAQAQRATRRAAAAEKQKTQ